MPLKKGFIRGHMALMSIKLLGQQEKKIISRNKREWFKMQVKENEHH